MSRRRRTLTAATGILLLGIVLAGSGAAGESDGLLSESGIVMSAPLGFRDNFALGMKREQADRLGIGRRALLEGRAR
ncbi:MAG: hypothetical protein ACR2P8_06435, partial [Myxococcota bacterium]